MIFGRLATACLLAAAAATAHAQGYPGKPITIVVPFPPGAGVDVLTRAIGAKLSERWKQPIVFENKAGAGGVIGTAQVAKAAPDGYTLLATVNQTMVGSRFLYKKLAYDPDKSFEPPEIVDQIRSAVREVLSDRQFAEQQVTSKGLNVIAGDGKQLRDQIAGEVESTAAMIKAAGVVAE